jgi:asparagine synthase (glutamine-hydrolysing)
MEHLERPIFAHVPRWTTSQRAVSLLSKEVRARVGAFDPLAFYERTLPPSIMSWSPLARDQYVEAKSLLAGYLLAAQGDRVAMASSVEGRYPYLDHRLVEFASRIPSRYKIRGLTEKAILRRALFELLPADVVKRTKQPYRAPDSQCFFVAGQPLDYVAELLSPSRVRSAGLFDPEAVRLLFEKCRAGRATGFADNQAFVGVLSTMLLDEQLVRGRRVS